MPSLLDSLSYQPVELGFGTSGLRGLARDMTDLECYLNVTGFLKFLKQTEHLIDNPIIYIAGDLRDSTPRILRAVHQATLDRGFTPHYAGLVPTPAVAYHALEHSAPCIMVTGSHIPANRNGIKFYKSTGEVLKPDEAAIQAAVATERATLYASQRACQTFDSDGNLHSAAALPAAKPHAAEAYLSRLTSAFDADSFSGKTIVVYEHSAVGRDLLVRLLQALGATVIRLGRSDTFIPIDSENVTPANREYFRQLAKDHPEAFAIISTDGDGDRPFVIDADGTFHRGDVLGAVVADFLEADFAAYPISSSDAVDTYLASKNVTFTHTKIGSPYVIDAMQKAARKYSRVVGWEVNGGFFNYGDIPLAAGTLRALPTRDAALPIVVALLSAIQQTISIKELFTQLPQRFTQAGLIDNFPIESSRNIVARLCVDTPQTRGLLKQVFTSAEGFTNISAINALDGIRISFNNGDIAHLRPSSNAPQLRIYSVANSQKRADKIVALAIHQPNGLLRKLAASL